MLRKLLLALLALLIIIQFFRPERNLSDDNTASISTKYALPDSVETVLRKACYDCHSNKTVYPWYANVQPVAWWLSSHVEDGKRHLNYSSYTTRPLAIQFHKFEETVEEVEEGNMPLESYTWLGVHADAKLSDAERKTLISWAKAQMDTLHHNHPPDSLVRKPRPGA
ncbi:MAG TPA: heme-binding domain-containing protein [Chryseolinea sp.]|nr:heme-binding domain-containing protein [Chryseolinea sp.]